MGLTPEKAICQYRELELTETHRDTHTEAHTERHTVKTTKAGHHRFIHMNRKEKSGDLSPRSFTLDHLPYPACMSLTEGALTRLTSRGDRPDDFLICFLVWRYQSPLKN